MTKKGKSKAELLAENKELRKSKLTSSITEIVVALIRYGTIALCAYFLFSSMSEVVVALSGKATNADILVNFLGNLRFSNSIAALFGFGGITYGVIERKERQKMIQRQHGRIKEIEKRIDPKRSSSNIAETGDTHPDDM